MASEQDRLAQIFIWRQASAPDIDYARQVLSFVNPDAARVVSGDDPPLRLLSIFGPWPDDPWQRVLLDMRDSASPDGTLWTDTTQYDLAGWQGMDERTGDHIFVVTAYRKANSPPIGAFQGAPAPAPSYQAAGPPVPQMPYYPQYPTGPLAWPPPGSSRQYGDLSTGPLNPGGLPSPYYPQVYPILTRPLGGTSLASPEPTIESYAPYYAGFPQRFFAGLIDLVCLSLFEGIALLLYVWLTGNTSINDFGTWFGTYAGFFCLSIVILTAYHVTQWTIWGQTLGKSLLGIKIVDRNGRKPQFGRALLRMTGYFPSLLLGGIGGFLLIAFDPKRQGLHDKIAETYVIPERAPTPLPAGLPGYANGNGIIEAMPNAFDLNAASSISLANMSGEQNYEMVQITPEQPAPSTRQRAREHKNVFREIASLDESMRTVVVLPDLPYTPVRDITEELITNPNLQGSHATGALNQQAIRERVDRASGMERARELFRQGIEQMELGARRSEQGYKIESAMARKAAQAFREACELVPNSVIYNYHYGVVLRYAEGFEVAIRQFRQVLELDPGHYEARQQVAYGPRWHDAFAYPPWSEPVGKVPEPMLSLLAANDQPMTRLALLREGNTKVVAVLSRTPGNSWAVPLTDKLPAHIDIVLSRTPSGPIIAFYVVVEDKQDDPYRGETFLNPHDSGSPAFDACQLGQNLLAQLARQDHTYLVFLDENNRLLLSRRLDFDSQTQVNIKRCIYEVQTLPAQIMDPERFEQAARWHMEHFSLDQVK